MRVPLDWLKEYVDVQKMSPKEIGDAFTAIGLMEDKPFDGTVFDLEHRFDRSDWLSILGCARDLAAYLRLELKLPEINSKEGKKPQINQIVDIKVECPDAVNRFNTRVFRNIKIKASPDWLKTRLEEYGIPSINNIVDITNYVMVELGQPMHAQDLKKFRKQEIAIRKANNGERLCTFLGDEVELYPEAFVLTQDSVPTVLGGIVGGKETGVDENTTDIILDAGNYNQNIIRKVSRKLKIQNETVQRYDKFLHPKLTEYAIQRASYLIAQLAGGEYFQNADWYPAFTPQKEMGLRYARVQQLSGIEPNTGNVENILTRLGYRILKQASDALKVEVPYFRTDVEVEDDIVSDILRINGYAKIPTTQIQSAPPIELTSETLQLEEELRDAVVQLGGHECITDPLVSRNGRLTGQPIMLVNAQNLQKNTLRTSISQTLEAMVPNYTKNQIRRGILFEIGKVYFAAGDKATYTSYKEVPQLECLIFDTEKDPKELHIETSQLSSALLKNLGIENVSYTKVDKENKADIYQGDVQIGEIRYNGFTLFISEVLKAERKISRVIADIQTPNTIETSLVIPKDLPVGTIINAVRAASKNVLKVEFMEEYTGKEIGNGKRSILIKTYFKPAIKSDEGIEIIDCAINALTKTADVTVRS